jgi:hypothetical protein
LTGRSSDWIAMAAVHAETTSQLKNEVIDALRPEALWESSKLSSELYLT